MGSRLRRRGQMCERGARSVASSDRWCTRCVNVNGFLSRLHLTKSIIMNGMNTICGAAINSRRESDQNLRGRFIQENVSVHFNGYRVSRRRQPRSLKAKNKNWDTSAGAPRLFPDSIISYVPPESLFLHIRAGAWDRQGPCSSPTTCTLLFHRGAACERPLHFHISPFYLQLIKHCCIKKGHLQRNPVWFTS